MKTFISISILVLFSLLSTAQSKGDNLELEQLKKTIGFLSDDKLEGRRTGTAGEKLAYEYIQAEFKKAGLSTLGKTDSYLQKFEVKDGRSIGPDTKLMIQGSTQKLNVDFFPLAYSSNVTLLSGDLPTEQFAYFNLDSTLKTHEGSPHFDLNELLYSTAKSTQSGGKSLLIIYGQDTNFIRFNPKDGSERLSIPVIYLKSTDKPKGKLELTVSISEVMRYGHNVMGMIDNKAPSTIVLGAHYDHLGYGEDHNSLYAGSKPMIHNGADDNASGVAGLLHLAKWIKSSKLKTYNYVFVAFSGEELGLYGSKFFVENGGIEPASVNYMINMDMIGRLNDSTKALSVGGFGTSPTWSEILDKKAGDLTISFDSSGTGPSDHTSFYRRDIPVLFFFTGAHKDYHKPTDDAPLINYTGELAILKLISQVITATDKRPKLQFTKTRETTMGKTSLRVTLGIMPDYTFSGAGVKVDGVTDNRPAQKAGVKTGDVLLKLGDHTISDVQAYMKVLNKFTKGETTKLKLQRGQEMIELEVSF